MNRRVIQFQLHWRKFLLLAFVLKLAAPALRAEAEETRHSLWRIDGASNVVYVLGSIHLLRPADFPLPERMEQAFSNSALAVFETDIGAMEKPEVLLQLATKARLPAGQTLQTVLSPGLYERFSNQVARAGLPVALLNPMQPFMAGVTLTMVELQKLGVDTEHSLDRHFYKKAVENHIPTSGLETVDFQINLMTGFSKDEAEELIKSLLDQLADVKKFYVETVNAWRTGDSAALDKLLNDSMHESPEILKRLLTDRSEAWVPEIQKLARSGTNSIVIVGAAHLVGEKGVIELLRKSGAKITQQ